MGDLYPHLPPHLPPCGVATTPNCGVLQHIPTASVSSMEDPILDERQPCRSCAGMLSDFSLFDALKSEEGVNFSQTAQEFYAAVDNGCLLCENFHHLACRNERSDYSGPPSAAFPCRPQSSSEARRDIIKNVHFKTTRPNSYDFKYCTIKVWSGEDRLEFWPNGYDIEAQEGKYVPVKGLGLDLIVSLIPLKRRPSSRVYQHSASSSTCCFPCQLRPSKTLDPRLLITP